VDQILRLYTETLEMCVIYKKQLAHWRTDTTDPGRRATIERILAMDDAELGLAWRSGKGFPGRDA